MAYDPYKAIKEIYNLKGLWETANKNGDSAKMSSTAQAAQNYYTELRNNGYGEIADSLANASYADAKSIHDGWAKKDKTSMRSYLYSLGKAYGMSNSDIDNIVSWDDDSGQVYLGGKLVGTPDVEIDGETYWSDTSVLDDSFDDYIDRTGTVRSASTAVAQENENLFSKYNQTFKDLVDTNPFETEVGKSILAKYDLAGLQGRDNAAASAAASNGGNIDSFAAANALRQQTSIVSQGNDAVLAAHQQRIDNARSILSDMGVNIERVFQENETAMNNDVARKSEIASVTGYVPTEWSIQNDAFLRNFVGEDGKLKAEYQNVDFQELINNAKASGNTELANKYAILRGLKIMGNFSEYGKYLYDGDVAYIEPQRTADYDITKQQIDSAERSLGLESKTALDMQALQNQGAIDELITAYNLDAASRGQITDDTMGEIAKMVNNWYDGTITANNDGNRTLQADNLIYKDPLTGKYKLAIAQDGSNVNAGGLIARRLYKEYNDMNTVYAIMNYFGYDQSTVDGWVAKDAQWDVEG